MAKQFENSKLKYTIGGFIFGLIISIIILIISIGINNYSFSINSIIQINKEHPINILLILSPIVIISILGFFAGTLVNSINEKRISDSETNGLRFEKISSFIDIMRKGESYKKDDEFSESDMIGKSLVNLQNELEKNKEEDDERKEEEAQRRWSSEGLALFGAILREYNDNIKVLANKVISELVKYIDAKQAGFYITDLSDPGHWKIREVANFAHNRKRFAEKEFEWGEGLIGACIEERKTTFLDKITDTYIEIESGLGSAKPGSIVIVPIITAEGVIHGAMELASFKIYEDFEIKFVEQIAESIATTISTLKINEETAKLLMESREQAQVLKRQEDELRKTISEMKRLQENADIQSIAFRAYQDSTNKALIRAEYSNDGNLQFANKRFLDLFEYKSNTEVQNEHISKFINPDEDNWFEKVSTDIISNNKHFEGLMNHISKPGKNIWIESSYIGLRNDKGQVEKILFLGINATDLKNNTENLKNRIDLVENTVLKLDLSQSDIIMNMGNRFLDFLDYTTEDVIDKNIFDFIPDEEKQHFKSILDNVKNTGKVYEGGISIIDKKGNILRLYGNMYSERDSNDNLIQISLIAYDYTQQFAANHKVIELEKTIEQQNADIQDSRERFNKRIEQTKEEVKNLYTDIETTNLFNEMTYELLPDAVITINSENKVVYINQSVLELWDAFEDSYTSNDIIQLLPKLDKKLKGKYLGDLLDFNAKEKILGDREEVYIIDSNGKQKKVTMLMVEASLGLRKQLTAFLIR